MNHFYTNFINDLSSIGVTLSEHQLEQFDQYYELLIKWNEVMNLTAITEFEDVCKLHFLDSLTIASYIDFSSLQNPSLIDIGTGAGFPGIPLKILFPNMNITLLDSLAKRLKFLDEVIDTLGLNTASEADTLLLSKSKSSFGKIKTLHGRAEDYAMSKSKISLRENFDFATARAVANLSTLSEYCLPYVKVGGIFVAFKSNKVSEELVNGKKAVHLLGGKIASNNEFVLPGTDVSRSILIIDKIESTSKKYPRKAGLPSKEPLC